MTVKNNLIISQIIFFLFIAISFLLDPSQDAINDGISYFGVHVKTIFTLTLAFSISAFFILRATQQITNKEYQWLTTSLRALVILMPLVILTPYSVSKFVYFPHVLISTGLFLIELYISLRFWINRKDYVNYLLLSGQFAGGFIALFSLKDGWLPYELWGQLLFQLFFSISLIRNVGNQFSQEKS